MGGAPENWPGPMTKPVTLRPWLKTTVAVEFCSALSKVMPVQVTVLTTTGLPVQGNPSCPRLVVMTATGTVPGATPPGTTAERFHCMLPPDQPRPETCPLTVQPWPHCPAQGTPNWPLGGTRLIACCTDRLAG